MCLQFISLARSKGRLKRTEMNISKKYVVEAIYGHRTEFGRFAGQSL